MGSPALTLAQDAVLARRDARVAKAQSILDAALEAPDAQVLPKGSREARIAADANLPQRNAPVYLAYAKELVELQMKLDAGLGDDRAPKLVHHVVHIVKAREYERVELAPIIDVEVTNGNPKDKGSPSR